MSAKKQNATILGIGVAACAACCAGPILGVLAVIGVSSAAGFLLFGTAALVIGAAAVAVVVVRRNRRLDHRLPLEQGAVHVEVGRREAIVMPREDLVG